MTDRYRVFCPPTACRYGCVFWQSFLCTYIPTVLTYTMTCTLCICPESLLVLLAESKANSEGTEREDDPAVS